MDCTQMSILYTDIEAGLGLVALLMPWLPVPSNLKRKASRNKLIKIITEAVEQRRSNSNSTEQYKDLLQILSDTTTKEGKPIDSDIIPLGIIQVLLAATTSTPVVCVWTLIYLLQDKALLNDIINEINTNTSDQLNYDDIKKLEKLDWCIKETLRMTSAVIIQRKVMSAVTYQNYVIQPGHFVCVSPYLIHHDEKIFTNPNKYDPYRFSPERNECKEDYFLGFGRGRHSCPGEYIAYLEAKAIFYVMLKKFNFELACNVPKPNPNQPLAVIKPMQQILIQYTRK